MRKRFLFSSSTKSEDVIDVFIIDGDSPLAEQQKTLTGNSEEREQHLVECITLEWISNINIFSCVLIFPRFFHFQQKRFSPCETRQCAQFCFDRWHVRGIFNQLSVSCDLLVNLKGAENWEKEKNCVVEFSFRLSLKSRKCLGSSSRNYHSVAAIFNGFQSEEFAKRGFIFGDIKFFSSSH